MRFGILAPAAHPPISISTISILLFLLYQYSCGAHRAQPEFLARTLATKLWILQSIVLGFGPIQTSKFGWFNGWYCCCWRWWWCIVFCFHHSVHYLHPCVLNYINLIRQPANIIHLFRCSELFTLPADRRSLHMLYSLLLLFSSVAVRSICSIFVFRATMLLFRTSSNWSSLVNGMFNAPLLLLLVVPFARQPHHLLFP